MSQKEGQISKKLLCKSL